MHKKVIPTKRVGNVIGQYPHCDPRVLHAPGECEYCDRHMDWQELRFAWGIAFTGYEPDGTELPDPATTARPLEKIERWPRNRPTITTPELPPEVKIYDRDASYPPGIGDHS